MDPASDPASVQWVRVLGGSGAERDQAVGELHAQLVRIARAEVHRRTSGSTVAGPEADDLAYQAAADALLAILAKLATFRGESRFTTWAYRFVMLEVSNKVARHYWRKPTATLEPAQWAQLPDRLGADPGAGAEASELVDVVRGAVSNTLSEHQRQIFIAIVVNGVPLEAVAVELGMNRGAVYKALFDARRKIRAALVANGYLRDTARGAS